MERKLRPIYDFLDEENYKGALLHCAKMLKKHGDSHLLLSLKSLALNRVGGREQEALAICDTLKAQCVHDPHVIQNMVSVYKFHGRRILLVSTAGLLTAVDADIVEIYQLLAAHDTQNEEVLAHLFMANVRKNDFKAQQQTAMKLYQLVRSKRYLFWNIVSLVLQAEHAANPADATLPMTLAHRMTSKCVEKDELDSIEELKLLFIILEMQGKHQELLEHLNGKLGSMMKIELEREKMKMVLQKHLALWPELKQTSHAALLKNSDEWECHQFYLEAVMELSKTDTAVISEASDFIAHLISKEDGAKYCKRGQFIARLELLKLTGDYQALFEKSISFLTKFSSKLCTFDDVSPYIVALIPTHRSQLLEAITVESINLEAPKEVILKAIVKDLCARKLLRVVGAYDQLSLEDCLREVETLMTLYRNMLPFGTDLDKTERKPGDDYLLLAVHFLIDAGTKWNHSGLFLKALGYLQEGIHISPANFQMKLVAIRLFQRFGCFSLMQEVYDTMDIKNILHETIGHFFVNHGIALGCFSESSQPLRQTYSIYSSNKRETPEMICLAFKNETLSKIQEFVNFGKRLENSLEKAIVSQLSSQCLAISSFIEKGDFVNPVSPAIDNVTCCSPDYIAALRDNRDFKVMASWEMHGSPSVDSKTRVDKEFSASWVAVNGAAENIFRSSPEAFTANCAHLRETLDAKRSDLSPFEAAKWSLVSSLLAVESAVDTSGLDVLTVQNDPVGYATIAKISHLLQAVYLFRKFMDAPKRLDPAKAATLKDNADQIKTAVKPNVDAAVKWIESKLMEIDAGKLQEFSAIECLSLKLKMEKSCRAPLANLMSFAKALT